MLHDPIFSPKDFEKQKPEIEMLMSRIPNLESRKEIVEQWQDAIEYERLQNKKEEDIQGEFLHKFFGDILGYQYGTHLEEENIRLEASTLYDFTKPDGVLGFFSNDEKQASEVRAVIELKRYGINLDKPQNRVDFKGTPVEQAFSYASKMGKKCDWVIVSDFAEIRLYRYPNANKYERFHILTLLDGNNFQHFLFLLAKNQLFRKDEDANITSSLAITQRLYKGRMDFLEDITNQFYARYKLLREVLFNHIRQLNTSYAPAPLFTATQKILDRLIFMRFVSEIGLTEQNILKNVYQYSLQYLYDNTEEVAWVNIRALFSSFDTGYKANIPPFNGGLFAPDPLINKLIIKENYLKDWIKFLLDYDFQYDLKVDILGHIFEQSITDIQKLQARNFEPEIEEKANGKVNDRKQFGVFYTPQYVTQYIVKQTIGDYLEEKKAEIIASLGVPEITEIADDFQAWQVEKPSLTIEEVAEIHLQFWQKYKQCLESITVLDPACGSGAFLNAVFDFLYEKNVLAQAEINKLQAPKTPDEPQTKKKKVRKQDLFAQAQREEAQKLVSEELEYMIKRDILLKNVYGVDLNFESVEITKLSLWLKVANKRKQLPSLTDNIKRGNSLIDSPEISSYAFNWQKEFPHIFKKGGFDLVVGNPPYGAFLSNVESVYINQHYKLQNYQLDTYFLFIERATQLLLKKKGVLGFIIPNTWLLNIKTSKIRSYIFTNYAIKSVRHYANKVFPDAVVDTQSVVMMNKEPLNRQIINIQIVEENDVIDAFKVLQKKWIDLNGDAVNLFDKNEYESLKLKIAQHTILDKVCQITQGCKPFQVGKGNPKQTQDIVNQKPFVSNYKKDDTFRPLLRGSLINKYVILWDNNYWIQFGDWLAEPRYSANYEADEKIVIRQTGDSLIATLDNQQFIVRDNLYSIISKSKEINIKYILGIINSKLMNWYYQNIINYEKGEALAQVKRGHIARLPIKLIDVQNEKEVQLQNQIIKKVDALLKKSSKKDLAKFQQLEDELNQLIYQFYDLTAEEIALIEQI